jgi:hypothetical protein
MQAVQAMINTAEQEHAALEAREAEVRHIREEHQRQIDAELRERRNREMVERAATEQEKQNKLQEVAKYGIWKHHVTGGI